MRVQNKNASSAKTKALIRETFAQMLGEKQAIDKISVSELVKRANINRTTFYTHYSDIYGISEEMESETVAALFAGKGCLDTPKAMDSFIREMLDYFCQHAATYRMLLTTDDPLRFLRKLCNMTKDKLKEGVRANAALSQKPYIELRLAMFVDGLAEQFISFFRGKSELTLEELCEGLLCIFHTILE